MRSRSSNANKHFLHNNWIVLCRYKSYPLPFLPSPSHQPLQPFQTP